MCSRSKSIRFLWSTNVFSPLHCTALNFGVAVHADASNDYYLLRIRLLKRYIIALNGWLELIDEDDDDVVIRRARTHAKLPIPIQLIRSNEYNSAHASRPK